MPYFPVNEPALDPFNEQGWYDETSYKFEIPTKLSAGEHVLRVFLARSFGESLKVKIHSLSVPSIWVLLRDLPNLIFQSPF